MPAPVRGLNYRDSLTLMKPGDALQLDNIVCRTGYAEVRKGRQPTATGFVANVETIMSYIGKAGDKKLFAAAGTAIYDATASGIIGAGVVTGLTSAYWNYINVTNSAGSAYLICCNAADNAKIYDGTTWADSGFTGLTLTSFEQLAVWKHRVWVVEKNSMNAWYGATDAISGALTSFTFGGIFKRGGSLRAILNWTIDGGAGSDDYFVAVTSAGEAAVYKGTDPASATTFALVGVYYVGPPVGKRFYAQYGGDLLLLTLEGLLPLSKYLQSETVNKSTALSDRITQLLSTDVSNYGTTLGWEVQVFLEDNMVFVQVPSGPVGSRYQYVMSTITGAWSRFLIQNAITWCVQDQFLFMGDATKCYNAWTGGTDVNESIPYYILPAFSYFGSSTAQKKFNLGRLLFEADVVPLYRWQLLVDFNQEYFFYPLAPAPPQGNLWDVAIWDASRWGTLTTYNRQWFALAGLGYAAAMVVYGISTGLKTRLISIDYAWEQGDLL